MTERIVHMFDLVGRQGYGSVWTVLFIGFCFGAIILWSRLDKFEKMAGFMLFEDTLAPRMAMMTVALSGVGFYVLVQSGYANYQVKPTLLGGLFCGAVLFGIGLVILGKCPSAFFVSVSEGRIDALVGVAGGMVGGAVFTLTFPWLKQIMGPDLGPIRFSDLLGGHELAIVFTLSAVLLIVAFLIPMLDYYDPADETNAKIENR
jgi:uncharacterized membrane protein YedE/YeeE